MWFFALRIDQNRNVIVQAHRYGRKGSMSYHLTEMAAWNVRYIGAYEWTFVPATCVKRILPSWFRYLSTGDAYSGCQANWPLGWPGSK